LEKEKTELCIADQASDYGQSNCSAVTACDIDELYENVTRLHLDLEKEKIQTTNKFEELTVKLDEANRDIIQWRELQIEATEQLTNINDYLVQQSTRKDLAVSVVIGWGLIGWGVGNIIVSLLPSIKKIINSRS